MWVSISPSFSFQSIVVLPAASKPVKRLCHQRGAQKPANPVSSRKRQEKTRFFFDDSPISRMRTGFFSNSLGKLAPILKQLRRWIVSVKWFQFGVCVELTVCASSLVRCSLPRWNLSFYGSDQSQLAMDRQTAARFWKGIKITFMKRRSTVKPSPRFFSRAQCVR